VSLPDWQNEGRLKKHRTSKNEISQLLADAQVDSLSADRRFAIAYNAALMVSVAALAANGYRAANEDHHYWTIQSLVFTLKADIKTIEKFNKFRQKRNITDYERIGMILEQEVVEIMELAKRLRIMLVDWLEKNRPELL
jgi:hypothetical protein